MSSNKAVYKEFLNKRTQSLIWDHFLREDTGQTVQCKHCEKILKTRGGSTAALHTHMRTKHTGQMSEPEQISQGASTSVSVQKNPDKIQKTGTEPPRKKTKLTDYYSNVLSMEARVTRMAALDGIPLSKFCTSEDLRYLFKQSGYDLPKSPTTITKIVLDQSESTKKKMMALFQDMKSKNQRFTATFDEWTSTRKRRYLNINVHNKDLDESKYKNLGLLRIIGSMTADVGMQMLKQHLTNFGLSLDDDIISFTTDGASVMVKMGKNFDGHHQLCFAHGIQLAVIDVLYKFQATSGLQLELETDESEIENTDAEEVEELDDGFFIEEPRFSEPEFFYKDLIKKVRRVVKSFHKSPLKNDLLQKYTTEEYGKSIELILDCKTRWSSLSDMVGRFLQLKTCVMKTLLDLKSSVKFTEKELEDLNDIHCSLDVIKTTVLSLCRRDSNLIQADTALRFMLNKLDRQTSELSGRLASSLRTRIKERRTVASGVLQYLHNNEDFFATELTETFMKPSSDEIRTFIEGLLERLKFRQTEKYPYQRHQIESPCISSDDSNETSELTMTQQLQQEINKVSKGRKDTSTHIENRDLDSIIRVEMCIYDSTGGGREVYLTAAYNYLLSIQPTSVEAERAFSSAGYFCNKLRSSLSDQSLNALSFMRSHFQNKK